MTVVMFVLSLSGTFAVTSVFLIVVVVVVVAGHISTNVLSGSVCADAHSSERRQACRHCVSALRLQVSAIALCLSLSLSLSLWLSLFFICLVACACRALGTRLMVSIYHQLHYSAMPLMEINSSRRSPAFLPFFYSLPQCNNLGK